jgi:hypothetical protein
LLQRFVRTPTRKSAPPPKWITKKRVRAISQAHEDLCCMLTHVRVDRRFKASSLFGLISLLYGRVQDLFFLFVSGSSKLTVGARSTGSGLGGFVTTRVSSSARLAIVWPAVCTIPNFRFRKRSHLTASPDLGSVAFRIQCTTLAAAAAGWRRQLRQKHVVRYMEAQVSL